MRIFSNKDQYEGYNIYSMRRYVDKKRIIFNVLVCILTILALCLIIYYTIDTTTRLRKSNEFVAQILEYKELREQEEEKERQLELERQAKIPKITEQGKENYRNIYHSETKRAFLTFDDGPSRNTIEY